LMPRTPDTTWAQAGECNAMKTTDTNTVHLRYFMTAT